MDPALRKETMISGGIIVGSLFLFLVAFTTITGRIDDSVASIVRARGVLQNESQAIESLATLKRDAPLAERYQVQINQILPKQEELLGVSRAIDAVARVYDVSFRFSFQDGGTAPTAGAPGYVAISLDADGTYDDVRSFFFALESKPTKYAFDFEGMQVSATASGYHIATRGRLFYR